MSVESKICYTCKVEKPITEFNKCSKNVDGLNIHCKVCKRDYNNKYWHKTKAVRKDRKKINGNAVKDRNRKFVWEYLKDHPCVDCGESDIVVLEFDHRERHTKVFNVSEAVGRAHSLGAIIKEISKCDVRCANCHRRKTARQLGWAKGVTDEIEEDGNPPL